MSSVDEIKKSLLSSTFGDDNSATFVVKAEDLPIGGSSIDFSKIFFEPQVGCSYIVKVLQNPKGEPVSHRKVYKALPDPDRKGKTFHYISSGNSKTSKPLELFFELNTAAKDNGDAIAEKKIEKYLAQTNQGCVVIQVLQSPKQEEIGIIRLMTFASFGPNATIANMLNEKLNPSAEKIKQGFEKEDIFNAFGSSALYIECTETTYPGKNGAPSIKGRDFTKSSWTPKKRGAIAVLSNGKTHEFSAADIVNGELKPEVVPFFEAFVEKLTAPEVDTYKYFEYKEIDDVRNDKDTNDYLIAVNKKVDEIIPIIREKSLQEIANYGRKDNSEDSKENKQQSNVIADSVPDELKGSVMSAVVGDTKSVEQQTQQTTQSEADAILNQAAN